jgi:hypothetical protein
LATTTAVCCSSLACKACSESPHSKAWPTLTHGRPSRRLRQSDTLSPKVGCIVSAALKPVTAFSPCLYTMAIVDCIGTHESRQLVLSAAISMLQYAGVNIEQWLHGFDSVKESVANSVLVIRCVSSFDIQALCLCYRISRSLVPKWVLQQPPAGATPRACSRPNHRS